MKKIIIIYSFLLFQIINAQANDITSLIFTWIDEPNNFIKTQKLIGLARRY